VNKQIKKIIVVGGGTAGWLSAGFLSSQLQDIEITVIHSKEVPIIGVGETTVPQFRNHLEKMGLSEDVWMRESGSTFKYGVTFDNWRTESDTRWHGFGDFVTEKGINRSPDEFGKRQSIAKDDTVLVADYWIEMLKRGWITKDDYYQYASDTYHLVQNHRAHRNLDGHQYMSRVPGYAYNINAFKVGQTIKNHVAIPNGVRTLERHIVEVRRNECEEITGLVDDSGTVHTADLYIDCSGFKRLLIGPVAKWISFEKRLPCKNAVGGRVYYKGDEEKFCVPNLHATALKHGWSWRVPLRDDMGSGYVYDTRFTTTEQAVEELQAYWHSQGKEWDHKVTLTFDNGIMDRSAHRNVIACGLSSNFLEPLEATSISFTTLVNELLVAVLKKHNNHWNDKNAEVISRLMHREIKITGDFLWCHYALTERNDTEFWRTMSLQRAEAIETCHNWFGRHFSDIYRREKDFDHTRYNKYDWAQMITTMRIFNNCPTREIAEALLPRTCMWYQHRDEMARGVLDLVPTHWQLIQHINR
jgi:tryptophan halogenase